MDFDAALVSKLALSSTISKDDYLPAVPPQDVIGCVCINPGRLTKGRVGGTYGRLLIQRNAAPEGGERESPCLAAQVVKI